MAASKNSFALVLVALLVTGCATTGMGMGRSRTGALAALFTWEQAGVRGGQMAASLNTGQVYVGPIFQITRETQVRELEPLWRGWEGAGRSWDHWGPDAAFIAHHRDAVVANLAGPDGHMRCRFKLTQPTAGMAAGGGGECELPDGTTIGATFPALGWPG